MIYHCPGLLGASSGCSLAFHPCENSQRLDLAPWRQIHGLGLSSLKVSSHFVTFFSFFFNPLGKSLSAFLAFLINMQMGFLIKTKEGS